MEIPTEEEFLGWKASPVTQALWELLRRWQEGLKEQWAAGQFQRDDLWDSMIANTNALEVSEFLSKLIEMNYEEFHSGLTDEN